MPGHQNKGGESLVLLVSVTEWALAGQQTEICKHHEGKHQSTLDFFFLYNFFCKHFRDRPITPFSSGKENALSLLG